MFIKLFTEKGKAFLVNPAFVVKVEYAEPIVIHDLKKEKDEKSPGVKVTMHDGSTITGYGYKVEEISKLLK